MDEGARPGRFARAFLLVEVVLEVPLQVQRSNVQAPVPQEKEKATMIYEWCGQPFVQQRRVRDQMRGKRNHYQTKSATC